MATLRDPLEPAEQPDPEQWWNKLPDPGSPTTQPVGPPVTEPVFKPTPVTSPIRAFAVGGANQDNNPAPPGIPQPPPPPTGPITNHLTSPTPSPSFEGNWHGGATAPGLHNAFSMGLKGEAAVNYANENYGGGYAYYPEKNVYGIPGGNGYILQNGQGKYDYAPGDAGGGGGGGGNPNYQPTQFGYQTLPQAQIPSANPAIDDTFTKLMQGGNPISSTGQAGRTALEAYLKNGGDTSKRLESIREKMASLQRAQMNDARGELASRGLLSEGSTAQGPEMSTLGRIEANLTPQWTAATRDALTAGDANMLSAIQTATGIDTQQATVMLQAATSASQREQMLATLASKSLDQNMAWNEFIANYGLNRDQVMYAIQHGQIAQLLPLIQNFINGANSASQGSV